VALNICRYLSLRTDEIFEKLSVPPRNVMQR